MNCKVYKNSGDLYATKEKTLRNIKIGKTTYTWKLKKGETVQEKNCFKWKSKRW